MDETVNKISDHALAAHASGQKLLNDPSGARREEISRELREAGQGIIDVADLLDAMEWGIGGPG